MISNGFRSRKSKRDRQCNGVRVMVFNTTFNNISVISWWSVLSLEETTDLSQVTDKFYHIRTHNIGGDGHLLHR